MDFPLTTLTGYPIQRSMFVKLRQWKRVCVPSREQEQYSIYIEISKYQNDIDTSTNNKQCKCMMAEVKL
jgi:hypothetical protein